VKKDICQTQIEKKRGRWKRKRGREAPCASRPEEPRSDSLDLKKANNQRAKNIQEEECDAKRRRRRRREEEEEKKVREGTSELLLGRLVFLIIHLGDGVCLFSLLHFRGKIFH